VTSRPALELLGDRRAAPCLPDALPTLSTAASHPSDALTLNTVSPGRARSSVAASRSPRSAAPRTRDRRARGPRRAAWRRSPRRGRAARRRHVVGPLQPGVAERALDGSADQRQVRLEPEPLLPLASGDRAGVAPAVENSAVVALPETISTRGRGRRQTPRRRPPRRAHRSTSPGRCACRPSPRGRRCPTRPHRGDAERGDRRGPPRSHRARGRGRRGSRRRWPCRGRAGSWWRSRSSPEPFRPGCHPSRRRQPHRGGVLVVRGDHAPPSPPRVPSSLPSSSCPSLCRGR